MNARASSFILMSVQIKSDKVVYGQLFGLVLAV